MLFAVRKYVGSRSQKVRLRDTLYFRKSVVAGFEGRPCALCRKAENDRKRKQTVADGKGSMQSWNSNEDVERQVRLFATQIVGKHANPFEAEPPLPFRP